MVSEDLVHGSASEYNTVPQILMTFFGLHALDFLLLDLETSHLMLDALVLCLVVDVLLVVLAGEQLVKTLQDRPLLPLLFELL